MNKKLMFSMLLAATAASAFSIEPMWLRDVKLSPDGSKLAFVYKGAIYTVPSSGGKPCGSPPAILMTDILCGIPVPQESPLPPTATVEQIYIT